MKKYVNDRIKNIKYFQISLKNLNVKKQIESELNHLCEQKYKYQQKILTDINNVIVTLNDAKSKLNTYNVNDNLKNGYSIILDKNDRIITSKNVLNTLKSFKILMADGEFIYKN
jgi:exonuclease VII large subunit